MIESFFVTVCPGCKRRVSVAVANLGKNVSCLHCLTKFQACDPQADSAALDDPIRDWIEHTELPQPHFDLAGEFPKARSPK